MHANHRPIDRLEPMGMPPDKQAQRHQPVLFLCRNRDRKLLATQTTAPPPALKAQHRPEGCAAPATRRDCRADSTGTDGPTDDTS